MNELFDKIGYFKGLSDGLGFDGSTPEGKMFNALIGLVEEMAQTLTDTTERLEYLEEYVEEVDSDLCDLEQEVYEEFDDEDEEDDLVEIVCPSCGQITLIDVEEDDLVFECSNCGATVNAVEVLDELYGIDDCCCCGDDCDCEDGECTCGDECTCGCNE